MIKLLFLLTLLCFSLSANPHLSYLEDMNTTENSFDYLIFIGIAFVVFVIIFFYDEYKARNRYK